MFVQSRFILFYFYYFLCLKCMLGCKIQCFKSLLCFQGFWIETCVRIILPAQAGLIMRTQACSCVRMILPGNSNFIYLFLILPSYVCFVQHLFPCFYAFKVSVSHVYLFVCFHMLELGFYCSNAMNMHSHAHA